MQCNISLSSHRVSGLGGCPLILGSDRDRTDSGLVWPWPQGGFWPSAKQVPATNTPMGAQKPCDEPRVRRARDTKCGRGPAEVFHFLAQCPASGHPSLCRSREVLAARECLEMELEHVCFDEPSATGPGWQTPTGVRLHHSLKPTMKMVGVSPGRSNFQESNAKRAKKRVNLFHPVYKHTKALSYSVR